MPDGTDLAPRRARSVKGRRTRNGVPALAAPRTFDLVIAPKPFSPAVETMEAPEGSTIAEILAAAVNAGKLAFADVRYARVFVEGHELDLPADLDAKPAAGVTVNIAVTPQGGNHGLAKVLKTLLDVVITAIAIVVGGPIGMAIAIGGHLLVNALFKDKGSGGDTGNNYSIDSQSNSPRLHEMMPLVLGPRTIAPDLAGSAFTRTVGDKSYIVIPVAWDFGPCELSSIKVGNTPLASFPAGQVTVEHFLTPGPRNSTLYPMRIVQQSFSDLLDGTFGGWTVHSTDVDCERFEIDLVWPQFYYASSSGKVEPADMNIWIEYSPYGLNTWTTPPAGVYPSGVGLGGRTYPANEFYATACTKERVVMTTGFTFPTKGRYDIRLKRTIQGGTSDQNVRDVTWAALRTIENVKPFPDETLAISVFQFEATSTVNGTVDQITAVVTPHSPKCVGGVWYDNIADWTADTHGNAVRAARRMLVGPAALEPYTDADLDSSWATQHDLIEANGWYGSVDIRSDNVSQQDVLTQLEQIGRFNTFDNGSKLCITPDWEKPAPRHMFTGRSAADYHYKRSAPDKIHGVLVKFPNLGEDCRSDELVVPADGYTIETAEILEVYEIKAALTDARAFVEGRRYLAKRELLQETHEWTAFDDATLATLGDRVKVRWQSELFGKAEGRIKARRFSGALVAGVRLDNSVTLEPGKSYALTVRSDDQVLDALPLVNSETTTRELQFATPLAVAHAPKPGDLFAFGEVALLTEDLVITDVSPNDDGVQFQAMPYRWADIAAAESGDIPPLNTALTPLAPAPTPHVISKIGTPDGVVVVFSVPPQRQSPISSIHARWRTNTTQTGGQPGSWQTLQAYPPTANTIKTPPIPYATAPSGDADAVIYVDVEVTVWMANGQHSTPDDQAYGIPVRREIPAPADFAAIGGVRVATDGSSHPVIAISADAVTSGLVSDMLVEISPAGANTFRPASCSPLSAANPVGDAIGVLAGASYDVRAKLRTSDGWVTDDWTVIAGVDVDPNTNVASAAASVPWTGVTDPSGTKPTDNADVTGANTAAGIIGQGLLATLNALTTAIANASNLLRFSAGGLFTGELTADTTASHTASAIAGQGSLATLSALTTAIANASNLLRYSSGGLFTGDLTADQTSTHTASGIAGQGALATLSTVGTAQIGAGAVTASRQTANDTSNLIGDVTFSDTSYWTVGALDAFDTSTDTTSTLKAVKSVKHTGNGLTAQSTATFTPTTIPVEPGASYRVFMRQLNKVGFNGWGYIFVDWFKQDGTAASTSGVQVSGTDYRAAALSGADVLETVQGRITAPSDAAKARFRCYAQFPTAVAAAGSVLQAFPRMHRAVETAFLTSTAVVLGLNVVQSNGSTSVTDATAITSLGTASAIAGQGSLATLSALTTAIANASNLLRYTAGGLFSGELTADTTSSHTAAAFTGQGALATLNTINSSGLLGSGVVVSSALAATAVIIGTNIVRADGTTSATETIIVTALGIASAITGQAAAATDNTIATGATKNAISLGKGSTTTAATLSSTSWTDVLVVYPPNPIIAAGQWLLSWDFGGYSCNNGGSSNTGPIQVVVREKTTGNNPKVIASTSFFFPLGNTSDLQSHVIFNNDPFANPSGASIGVAIEVAFQMQKPSGASTTSVNSYSLLGSHGSANFLG